MKKSITSILAGVIIAVAGFSGIANADGNITCASSTTYGGTTSVNCESWHLTENPTGNVSGMSASPFKDVKPSMPHYKEMVWMGKSGLSTGWSDGTYRPYTPVKRDAMIAFLYRMEGSPKLENRYAHPFNDVNMNTPHYEAIVWAYQSGIALGWEKPDGTRDFRPTQPVKRDAVAAFLYRQAGSPMVYSHYGFKDVKPNQVFAVEMAWMQQSGLSTGWSDGTYRPLNNTNRDAMAAFMYRADQAGVLN